MKIRRNVIRDLLSMSTGGWPQMRRALRALTDAELAEAEALEKLDRRRANMLRALFAERKARAGRKSKMLRLTVASSL